MDKGIKVMNENNVGIKSAELIHEMPKGLLCWYDFEAGKRALYIYKDQLNADYHEEPLFELLCSKELCVDAMSTKEVMNSADKYHYIVFSNILESEEDPIGFLCAVKTLLYDDGTLLFGMNNRLGSRYFCGDRDEYTGRNFDGIEDYNRVGENELKQLGGRLYSREEVRKMLEETGLSHNRFYSVLPQLGEPQQIYAEDMLPNEELDVRFTPYYNSPQTIFLEEESLYRTLISNGLFHIMANSYLVECPMNNKYAQVKNVTVSLERGRENALATIIRRDEKVIKRAVYKEGHEKIRQLQENSEYLQSHGVKMIESHVEGNDLVMPFVKGEPVVSYFRRIMEEDIDLFLKEFDRFWQYILNSSEHVPYEEIDWSKIEPKIRDGNYTRKEDDPERDKWHNIAFGEKKNALGVFLKRGYIDLASLNCFFVDGDFVFYDQELFVDTIPAYTMLWRTIQYIYWHNSKYQEIYSCDDLMKRYGLYEYRLFYASFAEYYLDKLLNKDVLRQYRAENERNLDLVIQNRLRINYSQEEYEKLFINIFNHSEGRDLYLFGSGNYAKKFISEFGDEYFIKGIIDNNESKWGQKLGGIEIVSPKVLDSLKEGQYKIIVCIRNYVAVMNQLNSLGLKNYSIYDWSRVYSKPQRIIASTSSEKETKKKYHVGYVAGVFDLFHIGHVNLLRRAKEQCDYLVVGVVTDEQVMKNKRTTPYMPFEDRIEIVRACKYVDEAVEIPPEYSDTIEAYRRYQFDVQFSGSDYENDPDWIRKRDFLREHGSDLVFFPYTQSTSSTKLKKELRESEKQK